MSVPRVMFGAAEWKSKQKYLAALVEWRIVVKTSLDRQSMNADLPKILGSKRALRRTLAARPIAEKLRMLDALRARALAIRGRADGARSSVLAQGKRAQTA
jgi:hypothetical protein